VLKESSQWCSVVTVLQVFLALGNLKGNAITLWHLKQAKLLFLASNFVPEFYLSNFF